MQKYELSSLDKKILNSLILEGAQFTDSEIASKLRLSPTTVNYKIKKLKKEKVITDYVYRLNPYKLGYTFSAFCFIELSGGIENMKEVIYKLLSYPSVFSLYVLGGNIDILIKLYLTEKDYLGSFINWIGENLKKEVKRVSSAVITNEFKTYNSLLDYSKRIKLSEKEKKFLKYRINNPHKNLSEVAKDLKIHRNTASSYWKKFWEKGILVKKDIVLSKDYFKDLNFDFESVVFTESNTGEIKELADKIKDYDNVFETCSVSSRANLITFLKTGGVDETYKTVKSIYSTKNVAYSNTFIVFSSYNKPFII